MEHLFLGLSTIAFLFAFGYTMYALGAKRHLPSKFAFWTLVVGFLFQTAFLYLRGEAVGRCPLTNPAEILIFLSWSMVCIYLAVGTTYRISLMGAFTAPFAFMLQLIALMLPAELVRRFEGTIKFWAEAHAALSVVSFGAFALACVAGTMYLIQQRMLKRREIHTLFYHLPPIVDLAVANRRLLVLGLILLTGGLLAGFGAGALPATLKLAGAAGVWLLYASILLVGKLKPLSSKRIAALSVAAFGVSLVLLYGITLIATRTA